VGMWGANDPDCRKPMIWDDITYADEVYNFNGSKRWPDKVAINQELKAHYKKLIAIRDANPALQLGSFKTLIADNGKDIYVFEREYKGRKVVVALNNSSKEQVVDLSAYKGKTLKDLLNGKSYSSKRGSLILKVSPKWGAVVKVE